MAPSFSLTWHITIRAGRDVSGWGTTGLCGHAACHGVQDQDYGIDQGWMWTDQPMKQAEVTLNHSLSTCCIGGNNKEMATLTHPTCWGLWTARRDLCLGALLSRSRGVRGNVSICMRVYYNGITKPERSYLRQLDLTWALVWPQWSDPETLYLSAFCKPVCVRKDRMSDLFTRHRFFVETSEMK